MGSSILTPDVPSLHNDDWAPPLESPELDIDSILTVANCKYRRGEGINKHLIGLNIWVRIALVGEGLCITVIQFCLFALRYEHW